MKEDEKEGIAKDNFVHNDGLSHLTASFGASLRTAVSWDDSVGVNSFSVSVIVFSFRPAKRC